MFVLILGGTLLGLFLRKVLPTHHLSEESKHTIQMGMGLIVTLSALVLGLLIAAAKGSFDTKSVEVRQSAAKLILLDSYLRQFGPETDEARDLLRRMATQKVSLAWIADRTPSTRTESAGDKAGIGALQEKLLALKPANEAQRWLHANALEIGHDLAQTRWLLFEHLDAQQIGVRQLHRQRGDRAPRPSTRI